MTVRQTDRQTDGFSALYSRLLNADCECLPESINLSSKGINDDAVCVISFGLYNNTTVKELDLSCNNISMYGMNKLSDCIKHPIHLEYVDLSGNDSSPWGVYCAIIRNCCVSSLILCGCEEVIKYFKEITDNIQINTMLRSLTLYASKHPVDSYKNVALKAKGNNTGILVIDGKLFCNTLVNNDEEITSNSNNRVVNIRVLLNADCECLPESINLSSKGINDDAVCLMSFGLYNNTTVKELDLSCNNISMYGMNKLSDCIKHPILLEYVDLSGNRSSPWGVYCAIIRHCSDNSLTLCGDKGMKHYVKKIADSLQRNMTLQSLTLCKIQRSTIQLIEQILVDNTTLRELNLSWKDDARRTKIFTRCKNRVNINILCDVHDEYSSTSLILSKKNIGDDAVYIITFAWHEYTTVKKLDLSYNHITIDGMNRLSECVKYATLLEYVDLSENRSSPWGVYCAVIRHCCVNSLTLCGDKGMGHNVKKIVHSLRRSTMLQSLTLCKIKRITMQLIEQILVDNTTLKELNLSWKDDARGTKIFTRQLRSNNRVNINILYDVHDEYSSKSFILSKKNIGDDAVYITTFVLHEYTTIKKLDLSYNNITINGMNILSECVKYATSLEYVDLSGNDSSPWGVYCAVIRNFCVDSLTLCGNEGMKYYVKEIKDSLQRNKRLQSLTLCKIKMQLIEQILVDNTTLRELNLSWENNAKGTKIFTRYNNNRVKINILCDVPNILSKQNIGDYAVYKTISAWHEYTTIIDLSCNNITVDGMNRLSECATYATLLEYVDLSGNDSSPWGVYCAVIRHCIVTSLTLCGDEGMEEYVKEITISLQRNTTLQSLTFCKIGRVGVSLIKQIVVNNATLKELNLSWENNARGKKICTRQLKSYSNNSLQRVVDVNILCDVYHENSVTTTNLPNMNIDDDALYVIAFGWYNDWHATELDLSQNNITNKGMEFISECVKTHNMSKFVRYVDLSDNKSSPWGVYCTIIKQCCVDSLTLCGNEGMIEYIQDIGYSLNRNMMLQSLTLCKIKGITMQLIKQILVDNTTLRELHLSWKDNAKGTKIFTTQLRSKNRLVNFNILSDDYSSKSFILSNITFALHDRKYMSAVNKLDLSYNNITIDGMNRLSEFVKYATSLEYVDLSGNDSSPWDVYCAIIRNCCVSSLTLCGEEGMKHYVKRITGSLQINKTLQSLILHASRSIVSHESTLGINGKLFFDTLVGDTTLNSKRVVNIRVLYDGSYECLLCTISLSNKNINDDSICPIAFGLCNNTTVSKLDLSCNNISMSGMSRLSECVKRTSLLQHVDLSGNDSSPWGVYCAIIKHCSGNSLTLCGCEGMKHYVTQITDSLQRNTTLQSLTLFKIRRTGLQIIKDILGNNTTLKEMNMSWKSKGTKIIHRHLTHDKFNRTHFDSSGHESLVDINIMYDGDFKPSSEIIDMSNKGIDDDAVCLIAFGLYNNTTIKKLNVSRNSITDDGAVAIADCLKANNTLQELNLSKVGITDEGLKSITEAIQVNKRLQKLDLSQNHISDDGMIMHCLKDNNTLEELNLSNTHISKEGLNLISEMLHASKHTTAATSVSKQARSSKDKKGSHGEETDVEELSTSLSVSFPSHKLPVKEQSTVTRKRNITKVEDSCHTKQKRGPPKKKAVPTQYIFNTHHCQRTVYLCVLIVLFIIYCILWLWLS